MQALQRKRPAAATVRAQSKAISSAKYSRRVTRTEAQLRRLLELLRRRPRHTHELRAHGISHPAARILDLTRRGFEIASGRVTSVDSDGFAHANVAMYFLVAEPGRGAR